ncbi:MAG: chromate transporter [Actinomycetota bacterium]|nr:chromate transporter [Actinomycetota bacterium]
MIYLELLVTFFKIGLFSFGGGYGMIPLIEREIVSRNWLTGPEFVDIISISEMTPGPISINTATFVGYRMGGVAGGAAATTGVVLPSLILILIVSHYLEKFRQNKLKEEIIHGIRPVVVALITQAVLLVAGNIFLKEKPGAEIISIFDWISGGNFLNVINLPTILIAAVCLAVLLLTRVHPILIILAGGVAGIILNYAGIM